MSQSREDFINVLRRNTDADGWLQPLLDDPNSAAVLNAQADIMARESQAIDRLAANASISGASGGSPGFCTVTLERAQAGTAGTIPAGYMLMDLRGVQVVTQVPAAVALAALTVVVPCQTLRQTEAVNYEDDPGFRIDPSAATIMDATATSILAAPAGTGGLAPTSFVSVRSSTPIVDGSADWLSVRGKERGVLRQPSEATDAYRLRVRNLQDAVSPIAIAKGVAAGATNLGLPNVVVQEPFDDQATPSLKLDKGLGSFSGVYLDAGTAPHSPVGDFLDDAAQGKELVGLREARAYIRVLVPAPHNPDGTLASLEDPDVVAALLAVYAEGRRLRAAGVQHDVYVSEPLTKIGVGQVTAAVDTVAFTLTPPALRAWFYRDGWADHDGAVGGFVPTSAMTHRVRFTFTDATTFTTAASNRIDSERLTEQGLLNQGYPAGKRINKIEGLAKSDGTASLNMVGTFFVEEVVDP